MSFGFGIDYIKLFLTCKSLGDFFTVLLGFTFYGKVFSFAIKINARH